MSCPCCISNYNKGTKTEIKCYFDDCNFSACKECIRTYLTGTTNEPHCMHCRKKWDLEFTKDSLNSSFMQKEYREHRKNILVDRTISQIQEYYPGAILISQRRKDDVEIRKIHNEIGELQKKMSEKYKEIDAIRHKTNAAANQVTGERRKFVMPCQTNGCRGMLSTAYKCDLCDKYTCSKCFESIDGNKDEHVCVQANIDTAEEIRKNTRPCPTCGCRISKIDGCFAENMPILLWNGQVKMSQHIEVGDVLIGDDGNKRIVEEVCSGQDDLYEIEQNDGITYIVNSKHTLALQQCGKHEILHMTVDEYMQLSQTMKQKLYGFKSRNGINYEKQDVEMDPYLLGLWIGDGTHTNSVIASNDYEIKEYINNWCANNDSELVQESKYKLRIRRKGYSFGKEAICSEKYKNNIEHNPSLFRANSSSVDISNKCKRTNPFTNLLKKYNLIGNKHIPNEYLFNDRETRLKLLAGIIDTDGYVSKESKGKRICIIQTGTKISEQIIYLAKSLGFLVNHRIRERKNCVIFNCEPKDYKDQYVINISGEKLEEIPTILPRKKCMNSSPNKDYFKTSISIKKIGFGNYYGWNVNDNHRFVLSDFTVVKNCDQMWCVECKTAFSWSKGTVEVGIVHNPHYFQWMRQNGGMHRTDALPGAGCNENRLNTQLSFIRDFFSMLEKSVTCENLFLSNCQKCGYTMDQLKIVMPLVYENNQIIRKTKLCEDLEHAKKAFSSSFFVNFHRFIIHTEHVTMRDLNYKIRTRNDENNPIYMYILGEETREDLSDYLVKRDIANARDISQRDIVEACVMVGKQILTDLHNELSSIEIDFSWRLIHDQLQTMRFTKNSDSLDYVKDKMVEFSNFYSVFFMPHKESIENLYRQCSVISNKYMRAINKYSAYSNTEMIKHLILHNSKKQLLLWDSTTENSRVFKFDCKESMTNSIVHFRHEFDKYENNIL